MSFGDLNDLLSYTTSVWVEPNGLCLEFKAGGPWFLCDLSSTKVSECAN